MSPRSVWPALLILTIVSLALVTLVSTPAEASRPDHGPAQATETPTPTPTLKPAKARVSVDPVMGKYAVGDVLTVTVQLSELENFYGGELRWNFDPSAFEVLDADPVRANVQVKPGSLLPVPGSFITHPNPGGHADNIDGKILFGGVRLPAGPVDGSGSLVIITFRVKNECGNLPLPLNSNSLFLLSPPSSANPDPQVIPFTVEANQRVNSCLYLPSLLRGGE